MNNLKHGVVVLTAPSGAGKTTIARQVVREIPELTFSTSATTRPPRDYEKEGVHYYFLSEAEFQKRIEADEFIEYEEVYPGLLYGTLASEIERIDQTGPALLDIDVLGAYRVKELTGESCVSIFISPPSIKALETRLLNRGTEKKDELHARLKRATMEMDYAGKCDYLVINDCLDEAVSETLDIIRQFLNARKERYIQSN